MKKSLLKNILMSILMTKSIYDLCLKFFRNVLDEDEKKNEIEKLRIQFILKDFFNEELGLNHIFESYKDFLVFCVFFKIFLVNRT